MNGGVFAVDFSLEIDLPKLDLNPLQSAESLAMEGLVIKITAATVGDSRCRKLLET